jgi:hypothetical protein
MIYLLIITTASDNSTTWHESEDLCLGFYSVVNFVVLSKYATILG